MLPYLDLPPGPTLDARLTELTRALDEMRGAVRDQSAALQTLSSSTTQRAAVEAGTTADIRAEMATLRSLALGRSQFPVPAAPAIPAWQRRVDGKPAAAAEPATAVADAVDAGADADTGAVAASTAGDPAPAPAAAAAAAAEPSTAAADTVARGSS